MRDRTGQKAGVDDKIKESHFHFFVELLLEHVTVNETGAFDIPSDNGNRGHIILYIPFLCISNKCINKYSSGMLNC